MIKPVTVHVDRSLNDAVNIMREKSRYDICCRQ